jgi:prepilin-type N-terminal cleavage/methylation domain-containing protein
LRKTLLRNQIGYTLIEVIVGLAISGILGGGIITGIYQIGRVNEMSNARVTSVKQLENALYYLNRDVQMSQSIESNGEDYWLKLNWTEWEENNNNEAIYIVEDGVVTRSYYVNSELVSEKPLASDISAFSATSPDTEASPPEKAWTIEMTAATKSGHQQHSETRQMKIIPRPGS